MSPDEELKSDGTIITQIDETAATEPKRAYILFLSGPLVGKLHLLEEGDTVIGRGTEATIAINDNRISRRHVQIRLQGETALIEDMGSTNGTFVNGHRVQQQKLCDGDKIQVSSSTIFKFALQDKTENIFHKELYRMAIVDPVTNVYNKRYFLERLKEEFSLARRGKQPLALVMIDIDHFKLVNDTHGHLAGDLVLQQVAALLKEMVRQEDLLARYGGEEFAVLLRGTSEDKAMTLAERMRATTAAAPFRFEQQNISVTISLGIAAMEPDRDYTDPTQFIKAADECLYYSKEHGRNRATSTRTKDI
ncbi:MAG: GGDEF domain-containing protein [Deltaproteobacteria bacterium]|nr:GGDEF domain-containing protein [Deltaproteobacteria bacterium]